VTPPEFSVLLLAWDEADPGVAVLGGAALPPTQHLVYHLAAQQPVLALYPHLPAEAPAPDNAPGGAAAPARPTRTPPKAAPAAAAPPADGPAPPPAAGICQLPAPAAAPGRAQQVLPRTSQLVGLAELAPARPPAALLAGPAAAPNGPAPRPFAAPRSQWPAHRSPAAFPRPQLPAAPYLGSAGAADAATTAAVLLQPVPVRNGLTAAPEPVPTVPVPAPASGPSYSARHPQAGDLNFDPDPELPSMPQSAVFAEATPAMGAAEAADLAAVEDDLASASPAPPAAGPAPARPPAPPAAPAPAATPARPVPTLDGLNFRVIEYARRAAQLAAERPDFRVIYAPNWPAWLAALEIRNRSGRPLVLYLTALATDFTAPAERGWLLEVERMALRRARVILVPTEALRQRLHAQYGATIGAVQVVAAADEAAVQQVLAEAAAG